MKHGIGITGIIVVILASCTSGPAARTKTQALYGMIYDGGNRPLGGVTVFVDGKYAASSDINGHFIIAGLKPKIHFTVLAEKQDFERAAVEVSFADPSHILYLRLLSGDQILREAENAVRERRWREAEMLLERAGNSGADPVLERFLAAILASARENHTGALEILGGIAETADVPHVYLLMADICQFRLDAPGQAAHWLERFLELRYDAEAARRLDALAGY